MENVRDQMWVPMTEQAIAVIYQLAEHPDRICETIIQQMSENIMRPGKNEGGTHNYGAQGRNGFVMISWPFISDR